VSIRTLLGSCVAITAWHPARRIGGMCHYMLADGTARGDPSRRALYATQALALFEQAIRGSQTAVTDYAVNMIGGGNMFPRHSSACTAECDGQTAPVGCRSVACRNVMEGRNLFEQRGFLIQRESVGGVGPRRVAFDLWSGEVLVTHQNATLLQCEPEVSTGSRSENTDVR
jgi:chemotaxis protein CheD